MKKVLSVLMCAAILLSANALVFASDPTEEQLAALYDYKIFQGDENGDLNLEDNITRAEFCKVISSALGYSGDTLRKFDDVDDFSDVDSEHWAYLYINNAKKLGLIDGYEDGSFLPEQNISLNEVIKIVVSALGYEPMAAEKGGYPAGYMAIAESLALTKNTDSLPDGAGEPALRKDVVNIISAALDVPIMQVVAYGDKNEYKVMDGSDDTELITLSIIIKDSEKPVNNDNNTPAEKSEVPRFNGPEYTGRVLRITDLKKEADGYTFKNSLDENDDATYVINADTYVYISANTVALDEIKADMYAQCWYYTDAADNIEILKIELMDKAPAGI